MNKTAVIVLMAAISILFLGSCEKVESPADRPDSEIDSGLKTIPAAYGHLVSVTTQPEHPGWFQLWFEDDAGAIRMVRMRVKDDLIHKIEEEIKRSGPAMTEETEDEG